MSSLITVKKIEIPCPTNNDKRAIDQRVTEALGLLPLDIPLSVLKTLPAQPYGEMSCVIGKGGHGYRLMDVMAESSYSIALDIGTTTLALALYNNVSRSIVAELKVDNPQISFGSDILTRMQQAMTGSADELNQCLIAGINTSIEKLCTEEGIMTDDIHALVAAGNTVMSHFFLNLDVSSIPVSPFVPVVRKPGFLSARELLIQIHPEALIYLFPNAGSYVGGDILAGILASELSASDQPRVLIDAGTNAEIVVGNKDWLLVGAGAAGPALEEGIAAVGRRAESGVVYDITIRESEIKCRTFDNKDPQGICGSGMVSLIAEMYRTGIIGNDGILNPAHLDVNNENGENFFALSCSPHNRLVIRQTEIDNFLRSKAAMFTLLLVILRSVGLQFEDIENVYVAGALGNGIDAQKAASIGMLPEWPPEKIIPIGNASLKGALMILKESRLLQKVDEISSSITYKHMHDDPEFMKEFRGAIFIPHTNPDILR